MFILTCKLCCKIPNQSLNCVYHFQNLSLIDNFKHWVCSPIMHIFNNECWRECIWSICVRLWWQTTSTTKIMDNFPRRPSQIQPSSMLSSAPWPSCPSLHQQAQWNCDSGWVQQCPPRLGRDWEQYKLSNLKDLAKLSVYHHAGCPMHEQPLVLLAQPDLSRQKKPRHSSWLTSDIF